MSDKTETNDTRSRRKGAGGKKPTIDGFILVDKPKGITSFDVIRRLRAILGFRKMGHMGTLDPNATGLLPICTGRATRLSQFLIHSDKTYIATIRLGQSTNTYDADGEPAGRKVEPPVLNAEELTELLKRFTGEIEQVPPVYSAKKVEGKRLYEYAREGKEIEPEPCSVTVHRISVLEQEREHITLEVQASSGFYVRSLAHDLGQAIGCGAYLEDLMRTRVGPLDLKDALTLPEMERRADEEDFTFIRPMRQMLPNLTGIKLNPAQEDRVLNGNHVVVVNPALQNGQNVRLMSPKGELTAIGEVFKPLGSMQIQIKPKVVFN